MKKTFEILIRHEAPAYPLSLQQLSGVTKKILRELGWKSASISLWLVTDRKMAGLNKRHLNHSGPTDVISFSQLEGRPLKQSEKGRPFLGDIVISLDTTRKQAARYGNSFFYELCFYICHGVLHLMGNDDKTREEAARMEEAQKIILKKIGITNQPDSRNRN